MDLEDALQTTGTLQPRRQMDVKAQANCHLKLLKVRLGQSVKKGDTLAEFDPAIARHTLVKEKAKLAALLAQKQVREANISQGRPLRNPQYRTLIEGSASRQDIEHADASLLAEFANRNALRAQIVQQQDAVNFATASVAYTRLVAPIDGDVVAINAPRSQTATTTYQAPTLMKLADLETMTVEIKLSEADMLRLHEGQTAYFTILGDPDKRYYGAMRAVQRTPERINNARFFTAQFDVANPERKLHVDMTVPVSVITRQISNALVVPRSALGRREDDGRYQVRVLKADGTSITRPVRVGGANRLQAQVIDGLSEGDLVAAGDASELDVGDTGEPI